MNKPLQQIFLAGCVLAFGTVVLAKLPAPSDEAKAKATEAAAKTAWSGKVAGYQLCKSQDKVAAHFYKTAKATGKETKAAPTLPPCADPGPFVAAPAANAGAPAPKLAAPLAAAPAKKP